MPLLTKVKDVTTKQTKFREEVVQLDPPKSKKFSWKGGNKKAMKMFDFLPSLRSSSKRATSQEHGASLSSRGYEQYTDDDYSSDNELYAHPRLLPAASRPRPDIPTRKKYTKGPKTLDRMSPITETLHDELRYSRRNSEHVAELDVISEYENHPTPYSPLTTHVESSPVTNLEYGLVYNDVSPTDHVIDEGAEEEGENGAAEEQGYSMHSGTEVDLNSVKRQQPTAVDVRSPLQIVENSLLDAAVFDLEAYKQRLNKLDADKLRLDSETAILKASHEKMKKEFEAFKIRTNAQDKGEHGQAYHKYKQEGSDSEDDDDLVSIRSSIDTDEEPTVHVATAMTITRVTPGMVKLVDIPPRKKNPNRAVAPDPLHPTPGKTNSAIRYEHDSKIDPFDERSENVVVRRNPLPMIERVYRLTLNSLKAKVGVFQLKATVAIQVPKKAGCRAMNLACWFKIGLPNQAVPMKRDRSQNAPMLTSWPVRKFRPLRCPRKIVPLLHPSSLQSTSVS